MKVVSVDFVCCEVEVMEVREKSIKELYEGYVRELGKDVELEERGGVKEIVCYEGDRVYLIVKEVV